MKRRAKRVDTHVPTQPGRFIERLTPGSSAAAREGCLCSPVHNHYGRGWGEPQWPTYKIAPGCELHDETADPPDMRRCQRCRRPIKEHKALIHELCLTPRERAYRLNRRKPRAGVAA